MILRTSHKLYNSFLITHHNVGHFLLYLNHNSRKKGIPMRAKASRIQIIPKSNLQWKGIPPRTMVMVILMHADKRLSDYK